MDKVWASVRRPGRPTRVLSLICHTLGMSNATVCAYRDVIITHRKCHIKGGGICGRYLNTIASVRSNGDAVLALHGDDGRAVVTHNALTTKRDEIKEKRRRVSMNHLSTTRLDDAQRPLNNGSHNEQQYIIMTLRKIIQLEKQRQGTARRSKKRDDENIVAGRRARERPRRSAPQPKYSLK